MPEAGDFVESLQLYFGEAGRLSRSRIEWNDWISFSIPSIMLILRIQLSAYKWLNTQIPRIEEKRGTTWQDFAGHVRKSWHLIV